MWFLEKECKKITDFFYIGNAKENRNSGLCWLTDAKQD